ncbi:MAG: hypothetical protein AB8B77_00775 [Alphaproteobacteria bacterium]
MARIVPQFDQDKIYRTTISARNQFTEEFARHILLMGDGCRNPNIGP